MNSDLPLRPRSLEGHGDFLHRTELLAALRLGASLRRDERVIPAESHYGVYRIRLNISRDSRITKGHEASAARAVEDIKWFLASLEKDLGADTRAWFIRAEAGERFILIENDKTGAPLGCLYHRANEENTK